MSVPVAQLLVVWVGVMAGLLATPHGRATLARWLADMRRVLGFRRPYDRRHMGRRWAELAELAAAEDAADPRLRRCAAVKAAYVAGEFDYDELDWRILLALQPPVPHDRREARRRSYAAAAEARARLGGLVVRGTGTLCATASPPRGGPAWRYPTEGEHCRFRELHSGSGYVGTVCDCGHDMAMHYNGGCNDCDAAREPLPTEPDPRLVSYGGAPCKCGHRPPKPSDSARSVRPASRQSHG